MAKLTTTPIAGSYASTTELNDNFDLVEAALENTLSLDGTTPNSMAADIDMDSNDILNVNALAATSIQIGGVAVLPGSITAIDTASTVPNVPYGDISAIDVQSALNELDDEKLPIAGGTMTGDLSFGTLAELNMNSNRIYLAGPTGDDTYISELSGITHWYTEAAITRIKNAALDGTMQFRCNSGTATEMTLMELGGGTDNVILKYSNTTRLETNSTGVAITGDLTVSGQIGSFKGASVTHSALQTCTNGATTYLAFDTEDYDTSSLHDTVTNNTRITIPSSVNYVRITGQVSLQSISSGDYLICNVRKDGTTEVARSSLGHGTNTGTATLQVDTGVIAVSSSEYFELGIYHDHGTDRNADQNKSWFKVEVVE